MSDFPASTVVYVLVAHGSRDPRSQGALQELVAAVRDRLIAPALVGGGSFAPAPRGAQVAAATLEFANEPLPVAIARIARQAEARIVRLVPLFLQAGVHAREDLPAAAVAAGKLLGTSATVELLPFLGRDLKVAIGLLEPGFAANPQARRLTIAHGSRRPGGNAPVLALATALDATPAFWATAPDLETQVVALVEQGTRDIAIAPYFLFPGSIADTIADRVSALQARFPAVKLILAAPLSARPELAQHLANVCRL